MGIFKILLGFSSLLLAWGLLFRTGLIFRLNAWLKENVFNDQLVLYSRRRLALLLFVLGIVAMFSGVENIFQGLMSSQEETTNLLAQAHANFRSQKYQRVAIVCRALLRSDPRNIPARELLSNSLWALGQKDDAFREAHILDYFSPGNSTARVLLSKETEAHSKAAR